MGLKRKPPAGNVRRVVSTGQNIPGNTTNKAGYTVQFESFEERILLVLFEKDRSIVDYRSQPFTLAFTNRQRKQQKYTPDFIVYRRNGAIEIHEVTLTKRQRQLSIAEREYAARELFQVWGWKYIVHTEQTLPKKTEVTNLLALLPYRLKAYALEGVIAIIDEYLRGEGRKPARACMKYVASRLGLPEATVFSVLCHLIWQEDIFTDLDTLLIAEGQFTLSAGIWLPVEAER